jgi:hypothetical protein
MIKIDIKQLNGTRSPDMYKAEVPVLPPIGAHMSSDKEGFGGCVTNHMFWWDENGELVIEVEIRTGQASIEPYPH